MWSGIIFLFTSCFALIILIWFWDIYGLTDTKHYNMHIFEKTGRCFCSIHKLHGKLIWKLALQCCCVNYNWYVRFCGIRRRTQFKFKLKHCFLWNKGIWNCLMQHICQSSLLTCSFYFHCHIFFQSIRSPWETNQHRSNLHGTMAKIHGETIAIKPLYSGPQIST